MTKYDRKYKNEEEARQHGERLKKVDWSDPNSLVQELAHAASLGEPTESTAENRVEAPKVIQ